MFLSSILNIQFPKLGLKIVSVIKPQLFLIVLGLIFSCHFQPKEVIYDDHDKLEKFIKIKTNVNLIDRDNKSMIILLQNEDCICTEPDMKLSAELIDSKKYDAYNKIVILNRKDHKFLKRITNSMLKKIIIVYNHNNNLLNAGYVAVTDRVIIYNNGLGSYYADLHITKPEVVREELL